MTHLTRRQSLYGLAALSLSAFPQISFAKGVEDRKFIFVILRGAMDGLSALMPDDAALEGLRGSLLPAPDSRLNLGNGFRLHPSLSNLNGLYQNGDAAFIHASATSYRNRSHFEAQDALETLGRAGTKDGWLNRALQARGGTGLAVSRSIPLALLGRADVANWSPPVFDAASDDLLDRLLALYEADPTFAAPLAIATAPQSMEMQSGPGKRRRGRLPYKTALAAIGRLMAAQGGPGIGMVGLDGWDTHAGQSGALTRKFAALDEGLSELKANLGDSWNQTCIVVCSEFGRTVAANGTQGTDHGTGGLTMVLGGAVKGGSVLGDWPGIKPAALFEGRDLTPANDIAAILKGVMRDHLGLDRKVLNSTIFPNSSPAFDGLIRS